MHFRANQHLPTEKLCSINYNIDQRAQWHVHCELATHTGLSFHFILYARIDCHRVTYCCIILNSHHTGIYSQALHKIVTTVPSTVYHTPMLKYMHNSTPAVTVHTLVCVHVCLCVCTHPGDGVMYKHVKVTCKDTSFPCAALLSRTAVDTGGGRQLTVCNLKREQSHTQSILRLPT